MHLWRPIIEHVYVRIFPLFPHYSVGCILFLDAGDETAVWWKKVALFMCLLTWCRYPFLKIKFQSSLANIRHDLQGGVWVYGKKGKGWKGGEFYFSAITGSSGGLWRNGKTLHFPCTISEARAMSQPFNPGSSSPQSTGVLVHSHSSIYFFIGYQSFSWIR